MLHVVPGDALAEKLRAKGLRGEILVWRDVLHEGPVRAGIGDDLLRVERARFLAERGRGAFAEILDGMAARDAALAGADEVMLHFEPDLHCQLQQLQVIDRLVGPGAQHALAARAWAAFRAPEPTGLQALLDEDTSALPDLRDALVRLLQEYPAVGDGLARTERLALELLDERPRGRVELFTAYQEHEPRPYLGDEWFWDGLADLAREPLPLLEGAGTLTLTAAGREVLTGRRDRAWTLGIDRWLGGVHLTGREPAWRWDPETALVIRAA